MEIWGGKNHLWKRVTLSLLGTTTRANPSPKRVKPSLEAPNKLKKTSLSNKALNYKKRKTMEPQFKGILDKEKERKKEKILNPYLSFSSYLSLSSSASYYCSAPCLHSGSPSPLFLLLLLLSLSLSFYFLVLFLC